MNSTYPGRPLAELADRIDYGLTASATDHATGPKFLRITDIVPPQVDWSTVPYCEVASDRERSRFALAPGDIVIARTGATVGYSKRIREHVDAVFASYLVRVRVTDECDSTFVGYVVGSEDYKEFVKANAGGAAQPNANARVLTSYMVPTPPLATQRKIAAILSAYDDLIGNNNRRIKVLEEVAQRIYREWFVDFRYPGHEDVALMESELGPIPEGWNVAPVGSVTDVLGGGTPSKKVVAYWEPGTITWFTPTDLTSASAMFMSESRMSISDLGLAKSSARLFPANSVMMTSRATIGVVSINTVAAATNQGFITCLANDRVGPYHLYFWLIDQRDLVTSLASGATFKEINKTTFRNIPFLVGADYVERAFQERMEPIGGEILNLLRGRRTLRTTRDILLPRLVSGEIDVSDLDIVMPEAAA